jgi:hypothetical protein
VVAVTEQQEVLERAARLVRLRRVEPRTANLGSLNMADLGDEDAVVVNEDLVAAGKRAEVAGEREQSAKRVELRLESAAFVRRHGEFLSMTPAPVLRPPVLPHPAV